MPSSLIEALRNKIYQQEKRVSNSFSVVSLEDSFLLKFLRSRCYNVNESYRCIWNYFETKKSYPQLFQSPRNFAQVFEDDIAGVLPARGLSGESIILCKPGKWNPSKFPVTHLLGAAVCIHEQQGLDVKTQENGIILIIDMKNTSFFHLIQLTPATVSLGLKLALQVLPIRYKEVHVLNSNWISQTIWTLSSSLLDDSIKNNTHFHKTCKRLEDFLPIEKLPQEYGGKDNNFSSWSYYNNVLLKKEHELSKVWRISL